MTTYELTYLLVVAILIYRAFHNLMVFWKNRASDFLFYFSMAQIFFAIYLILTLKTINVLEPSSALIYERLENACVPIMSVFFVLFTQRFRPVLPEIGLWVYVVVNVLLSIVILIYPAAYHMGLQAPKTFPVLGITIYETQQPIWVFIVIFLDMIVMALVMIRYLTKDIFATSELRVIALALFAFCLTALNDMAVALEVYAMPYIAHFGFLIVMLAVENLFRIEVRIAPTAAELLTADFAAEGTQRSPPVEAQAFRTTGARENPVAEKPFAEPGLSTPSAQAALVRPDDGALSQAPLFIRCLGPLEIRSGQRLLPQSELAKKRKLLKLFKMLITRYGKGVHREEALHALWPELGEANALNNLHALCFRLRKIFDLPEALVFIEDRLFLDPALVDVDFVLFDKLADRGLDMHQQKNYVEARKLLSTATTLYRGEFFEFDPYFEGSDVIRNQLQQKYSKALVTLCDLLLRTGDFAALVQAAEKAVRIDDMDESAWRLLFQGLAGTGRKNEAVKKYEELKKLLKKELDVSPDEETEKVIQSIRGDRAEPTGRTRTP